MQPAADVTSPGARFPHKDSTARLAWGSIASKEGLSLKKGAKVDSMKKGAKVDCTIPFGDIKVGMQGVVHDFAYVPDDMAEAKMGAADFTVARLQHWNIGVMCAPAKCGPG